MTLLSELLLVYNIFNNISIAFLVILEKICYTYIQKERSSMNKYMDDMNMQMENRTEDKHERIECDSSLLQ